MSFPSNPLNGQIYTASSGHRYIYHGTLKAWIKYNQPGSDLATPTTDGLMSAADYNKINTIVIPPPKSTLSIDGTETYIGSGIIRLGSGDSFVTIDTTGPSYLPDGRKLHEHTYSFNFTIDTQEFYKYMIDSGKFVVRMQAGDDGVQGDRGTDGLDDLPYGSDGPAGDRGRNAVFNAIVQSDPIEFKRDTYNRRAITSITTEEISRDENYIVIHRSIIGNPDAYPNLLRLTSDAKSTWLVCVPDPSDDTGVVWSSDHCKSYIGTIYYIDIAPIADAIRDEFEREVRDIKNNTEKVIQFWLAIMSGLFDEQKAALCCALEYCKSQHRNIETRRYIEQSRIQAAQAAVVTGGSWDLNTGELALETKAHRVVIDEDPFNSGMSVVSKTIADPSCEPGGFGTSNQNGLPNNIDPIGGADCVPGIAVVNGRSIVYSDCPPGFIPRKYVRDHYKGVAYEGESRTFVSDYSEPTPPAFNMPPVGYTATPEIIYSPQGSTVSNTGINCRRSSDPTTQTSLRLVISGDSSLVNDTKVYIKNKTGSLIYISAVAGDNGILIFNNLSIIEDYSIELSKEGVTFSPPNWINLDLRAGEILEILSVATEADPLQTGAGYIRQSCGSGHNQIHVKIEGDDDEIVMCYVRLYDYYSGVYRCGGPASPSGEVRFTGLGVGKYIVRASKVGSDVTISPDCDLLASSSYDYLNELRTCPAVEFTDSRGYEIGQVGFVAVSGVTPSSDKVEIILPSDSRYNSYLSGDIEQWPIELHVDSDDISIELSNSRQNFSKYNSFDDISCYFNSLVAGVYTMSVSARADTGKFSIIAASQNVRFIDGSGQWDSSYIASTSLLNGIEYSANTIVNHPGLRSGDELLIRFEVLPYTKLDKRYNPSCGAVGPRTSINDKRGCREIPLRLNPIKRTNSEEIGFRQWVTSSCGYYILPDMLNLKMSGNISASNLILCRVNNGIYTGGYNIDSYSVQVIVEQVGSNDIGVATSPLSPKSSLNLSSGPVRFKCTMLLWDNSDCVGDASWFSTNVVTADCNPFSLHGVWRGGNRSINYEFSGIDNLFDDSVKSEYVILLDSANRQRTIILDPGTYVASIANCCLNINNNFSGNAELFYKSPSGDAKVRFPNFDFAKTNDEARLLYRGLTVEFTHTGGPVIVRCSDVFIGKVSGSILLNISGNINHDISAPLVSKCTLPIAHIKWLRDRWIVGDCNACGITVAGQDYIVINHSNIGNCVTQLSANSIAWPVFDATQFDILQDDGFVGFKRDADLESMCFDAINSNNYVGGIGNLRSIKSIVFPVV